MILSFNLDFFCECNSVISSYLNVFKGSFANIKKYDKMPMAETLNINGLGSDMVWRSTLDIVFDNKHLHLEMSDNILFAMEMEVTFNKLLYNPLILITQLNKSFSHNEEGVLSGSLIDKYGICWNFVNDINDF